MTAGPGFSFDILHQAVSSRARLGRLTTPHCSVDTSDFVFCSSERALNGERLSEARDCGARFILANSYHLMLQPGAHVVARQGGLHKFMRWDGPLLTDSGGFQIFSMGRGGVAAEIKGNREAALPQTLLKIEEAGATFRSYRDGSIHTLSPESAIATQRQLGPDFVVTLDECTPCRVDRAYTARALARTMRWQTRSRVEFERGGAVGSGGAQALVGIASGGVHDDLRREGAAYVNGEDFFAQAVGDSLGGDKTEMRHVMAHTMSCLRADRPTHLLGIGGVDDIFHGVACGIDTFDCVHPTRIGRHGTALVRPVHGEGPDGKPRGHINLRNGKFRDASGPLEPDCDCLACGAGISRGFIHHLLRASSFLGRGWLTLHNMRFMTRLMAAVRKAIAEDRLAQESQAWLTA
jgi:queuine tRNA-ribosyltransferase